MSGLLFGINVPTSAAPGADPVAWSRRAEELGFDFVSASDHLHGTSPTFEPWTMLTWIAASTSRIGVATRVLGTPYRHPAVTAKMAESLDRLSGGRLILGLGGGASDQEFAAFGLAARSPRDKVDGMEEAVRIARGLWSERSFSFEGRLYRTDGAEVEPKPDHRIPVWLGTYGNRALAATGRVADGWIPTLEYAPPDRVPGMRRRILDAARDAGRDPDEITCVYNIDVRVDGEAAESEGVLSGSPTEVAERLRGFLELGFTAFNFVPAGPGAEEQAELLATEVIPLVREAV